MAVKVKCIIYKRAIESGNTVQFFKNLAVLFFFTLFFQFIIILTLKKEENLIKLLLISPIYSYDAITMNFSLRLSNFDIAVYFRSS